MNINFTKISNMTLSIFIVLITTLCVSIFAPYYKQRIVKYNKHTEVLQSGLCNGNIEKIVEKHNKQQAEIFKKIGLEELSYEGITTNCTRAQIYCSIPVILGAIDDMWLDSTLRALLVAEDWRLKALYGFTFIVGVVVLCYTGMNSFMQLKFLNALFPRNTTNTGEINIKSRSNPNTNERFIAIPKDKSTTVNDIISNNNNNTRDDHIMNDDYHEFKHNNQNKILFAEEFSY